MNSPSDQNQNAKLNEQLTPPETAADREEAGGKRRVVAVALVFFLLLLGLLGVLFLLPVEKVAESPPPTAVEQKPALVEEVATDGADDSLLSEAVAAREQFLSLQIEAESQNISQWGADGYQAIEARLAEADELLQSEKFPAASRLYEKITGDLQSLVNSREQRLSAALETGQGFLLEEKPAEAEIQFRQALAIEPSSEKARAGLERADLLAAVLASYQQALALEESGSLEEAVTLLEQTLELDQSYQPVQAARQRVQARINDSIFKNEMNILLSALAGQDFALAGSSLKTLKKLGINAEQVEQAETLVAEQEKQAYIKRLRKQVDSSIGTEQWQQALENYDKILSVAPSALFAVAGRDEAAKRAKLDSSLGSAIDRPQRLQDKEQRDAARRLLSYAEQIDPQGPKLKSQIDSLNTLLAAAETPVTVTMESDNQTDIVIYHVGRIGVFLSHRISLKPGTYTVVGRKPGFRDVRKEITIAPDGGGYRFDIRCEEPI